MIHYCNTVLIPYANGRKLLLIMDEFGAHCTEKKY